jgi:hypothetical protein
MSIPSPLKQYHFFAINLVHSPFNGFPKRWGLASFRRFLPKLFTGIQKPCNGTSRFRKLFCDHSSGFRQNQQEM